MPQARIEEGVWVKSKKGKNPQKGIVSRRDGSQVWVTWNGENGKPKEHKNTELAIDYDAQQSFVSEKATPIKDAAKRAAKAIGSTLRPARSPNKKKKKAQSKSTRLNERFESVVNASSKASDNVSASSSGGPPSADANSMENLDNSTENLDDDAGVGADTPCLPCASLECSPRGINNPGNDCYVISALQIVFAVPGFLSSLADYVALIDESPTLTTVRLPIVKALLDTHAQIASSVDEPINAEEVKNQVAVETANADFTGSGQQDASLFLASMISGIHEELKGAKNEAGIDSVPLPTDAFFSIELATTKTCPICGDVYSRVETVEHYLHLAIPEGGGPFTIDQCLITPTDITCVIEGDGGKPCGAALVSSTEIMEVRGKAILLLMNRVHWEQCGRTRRKAVKSPASVNAKESASFGSSASTSSRLIGNIIHQGNASSGHYIAHCRGEGGASLYCCDDSTISRVPECVLTQNSGDVTVLLYHQASTFPSSNFRASPKTKTKAKSLLSSPLQSSSDHNSKAVAPPDNRRRPQAAKASQSSSSKRSRSVSKRIESSERPSNTQSYSGESSEGMSDSFPTDDDDANDTTYSLFVDDQSSHSSRSSHDGSQLETPKKMDLSKRRRRRSSVKKSRHNSGVEKKSRSRRPKKQASPQRPSLSDESSGMSSSSDIRDGDVVDAHNDLDVSSLDGDLDSVFSSDSEDRDFNLDADELDVVEENDDAHDIDINGADLRALFEDPDNRMKQRQKLTAKRKAQLLRQGWDVEKVLMPKREIVPGVLVLTSKKDSNGERRKATVLEKIEVDDQGKPLKTTTGKPTYKWKVRMNDDKSIATFSFNALKIDDESFAKPRTFLWRMVPNHVASHRSHEKEYKNLGLYGFDFRRFGVHCESSEYDYPFGDLVKELWPGDPEQQRKKLNDAILSKECGDDRVKFIKSKVTKEEWWNFIGILIFASVREIGGGDKIWPTSKSPIPSPDGGRYKTVPAEVMIKRRFETIKRYFVLSFEGDDINDPWNLVLSLVDGYNKNRKDKVMSSNVKVLDESMSPFKPRTTKSGTTNGGMPHLSYIHRKPKPIGLEMKTIACSKTGVIVGIELQRGAGAMSKKKYHQEIGATAACTKRLVVMTRYCGRNEKSRRIAKDNKKVEHVYGDSWFASIIAAEELYLKNIEFLGPIKTNCAGTPLKEIQKEMRNWAPGSFVVMECTTDRGISLFFICYKYSMSKDTSGFIGTKNAGSTTPGRPYDAKWPDRNGALHSRNIPRPQATADYFEAANAIDTHNQVRQDILALEANWRTIDWAFRVDCTIIGMAFTDAWKLLRFHCQENMAELPFKEFAEAVVHDFWFGKKKKFTLFRSPFSKKKRNGRPQTMDHGDDNLVYEDERVFIIDKVVEAMAEEAHSIRKTDKTSGIKFIASAKRKCVICKGRAGLDENDKTAKKTDRECYHPHCRARVTKTNNNVTYGTFVCRLCEHKHRNEMIRLRIVQTNDDGECECIDCRNSATAAADAAATAAASPSSFAGGGISTRRRT